MTAAVARNLPLMHSSYYLGGTCPEFGPADWNAGGVERPKTGGCVDNDNDLKRPNINAFVPFDGLPTASRSSKSSCPVLSPQTSGDHSDDSGSDCDDTPHSGAQFFISTRSIGPTPPSVTTQNSQNRMPLSLGAIEVPGAKSQQAHVTGAYGGTYHERIEGRRDGNPVPDQDACFRKRIPSEKLLSHALSGRSHLDLSGKVTVDTTFRPAQGGYADVYKGYCSMPGKQGLVAIKRLRIHVGVNCDVFKNFAKEIRVWARLNHPNVLPLLGYMMEGSYPSLVSEWMGYGSLKFYMTKLTMQELFSMAVGIAQGLYYLHSNGVIHSDLKTDNVLVSDMGIPLLTDFGISRLESSSTTGYNTESVRGSTRWLAYEFFEISDNDDDPPPGHNEKTDVWSYGMTLLELITGNVPYAYIKNDLRVMFTIVNGELPSEPKFTGSSSDEALRRYMWSICNRCWIKDPKQRPSIARLLEDMECRS